MSYLWTDKITDYYYSNPELDTVAVLWTDPDDGLVREHYILVDEEDEQWRDFVKVVSYEDIDKRTQVRHEQFREEFREAFRNYAQRDQIEYSESSEPLEALEDVIVNFINDFDITDTAEKEQLFKLKLKIFDQEVVKNSGTDDKFKTAKTFIRKSQNPIEVLLGYMVFTNGAEIKMTDIEKFEVEGVYIPIK
jgi:hypothetical protein